MSIEDLRSKREIIRNNTDITLSNIQKLADESNRVADVAHNSREILEDMDREFESLTGLQGNDIKFLFAAVALQLVRIAVINELTRIEKAGSGNRNESELHKIQKKILEMFSNGGSVQDRPYYASMEHIITRKGVPYDAQTYLSEKTINTLLGKGSTWDFDLSDMIPTEKISLFKGADHRFTTLGHDPILGLVFGTGNIMTNTITCVKSPALLENVGINIPVLTTNHVVFSSDYKDPRIGVYASTGTMINEMINRTKEQPSALVAALIKQIIHIGTDMYTPCGIQIPGSSLLMSNTEVEKLTSYISTGDIVKIGASAGIAELINLLISTLHTLMYDTSMSVSRELYSVRTRKIIMYSNAIATGSNVIWVGANMLSGNETAIRQLDIGGLLVLLKRLQTDKEYIRRIKEEFVLGGFNKLIQGDDLGLQEVIWE